MKNINDIVVVINARLNSSRVKEKMIRNFANTNLLELAIKKILSSKLIPKKNFYVAVGEQKLIDIVKKYDINIFNRTHKSCNSEGKDIRDLLEWCYDFSKKYKYYLWINPCQPFLSIKIIEDMITTFIKSNNKSMITTKKIKDYFWNSDKSLNKNNFQINNNLVFNTKFVKETYQASHSMYIGLLEDLCKGIWLGTFKRDDPELFFVDEEETLDIDYEWEFDMCEAYYKSKLII